MKFIFSFIFSFVVASQVFASGVIFMAGGVESGGSVPTSLSKYRMESGALTTDTDGTNTTTAINSPASNTTTYKEGAGSCDFERGDNDAFYRTDTNLSSDFPGKSGQSNNTMTMTFWYYPEDFSSTVTLLAKYDISTALRSYMVRADTSGQVHLVTGYSSGASSQTSGFSTAISASRWYHIAFTLNITTGAYKIRIWDDQATSQYTNVTGTFSNTPISTTTAPFLIGAHGNSGSLFGASDGLFDDIRVFDTILSDGDIDAVRGDI
jgi:hypothetical protein